MLVVTVVLDFPPGHLFQRKAGNVGVVDTITTGAGAVGEIVAH